LNGFSAAAKSDPRHVFWLVSVFQRLGANVQTSRKTFVQTIQPAKEALNMEEAVGNYTFILPLT
jgi:hypothetical protein